MKKKITILSMLLLFAVSSAWAQRVTGITIDQPSAVTLQVGDSIVIVASVVPTNATNVSGNWSSSDPTVANYVISASRLMPRHQSRVVVNALKPGTATITVTTTDGNYTASCKVTVKPVTSVTVATMKTTKATVELVVKYSGDGKVYANGKPMTHNKFETITPDGYGNVTIGTVGDVSITELICHQNNLTSLDVSGLTALESIVCYQNNLNSLNVSGLTTLQTLYCSQNNLTSLNISGCTALTCMIAHEQEITVPNSGGAYKNPIDYVPITGTENIKIGTQTYPKDAPLTGPSSGNTLEFTTNIITSHAYSYAFSGTLTLQGYSPSIAVTGVTVAPSALELTVGGTSALTATVSPATATNKSVTWSSSNTSVATVSTAGVVTAVSEGSATITVKTADGDKTATCAVTVTAAPPVTIPVTGVTVAPPTLALKVGGATSALTVDVTPTNATIKNVTWSSSNTSIATVSTAGVVTAVSEGSATIYATSTDGSNKSGQCAVTVSASDVSNEHISGVSFAAYPNPTSGVITVTGLTTGKTIHIYSAIGILVGTYTAQGEETTLNLSNLSRGLYFINAEGQTIRIVVSG